MTAAKRKILFISSGQPSLNPRLVKEADTLAAFGHDVTVLYAYWNEWGTRYDIDLLSAKKWTAIRIGGDPLQSRIKWFVSRVMLKLVRLRLQKNSNFDKLADLAIARSSYFLIKAAKKIEADLYIAHNLGALPAAAKASALYNKSYGFDAEDFHRQEVNDDPNLFHYKLCSFIEDKYLPAAAYVTASSPLIAGRYRLLYNREIVTIRNVFPLTHNIKPAKHAGPVKLFWFSQTIGPGRGLELIIEAMRICQVRPELHLLGQSSPGYKEQLVNTAVQKGIDLGQIRFYDPVNGVEIFKMAPKFDIGLASETGFCLNNNLALSNKIFTYIQCGLAVAASSTPAQVGLLGQYPKIGRLYSSASELAATIKFYHDNREQLSECKKDAYQIGQTELNWELEREKFLAVVENELPK